MEEEEEAQVVLLDLGVERVDESKEMGLLGNLRGLELLCMLLGIRSRVALKLAMQISQLQLVSFRHPGK